MTESNNPEKSRQIELVALQSSNQGYCIEITSIREIRRWSSVTALPNSDVATLGVMNLRGAVIPILDLAARLGMPKTDIGERSVVVVIALNARVIGLLVDEVSEILSIEEDSIQPNPTRNRDDGPDVIVGLVSVGDRMQKVLNVASLLDDISEEAA